MPKKPAPAGATEIRVLKATALRLLIPPTVKNPAALAEQIVKAWPAKRLIAKYKVRVVEVIDGVDHKICN